MHYSVQVLQQWSPSKLLWPQALDSMKTKAHLRAVRLTVHIGNDCTQLPLKKHRRAPAQVLYFFTIFHGTASPHHSQFNDHVHGVFPKDSQKACVAWKGSFETQGIRIRRYWFCSSLDTFLFNAPSFAACYPKTHIQAILLFLAGIFRRLGFLRSLRVLGTGLSIGTLKVLCLPRLTVLPIVLLLLLLIFLGLLDHRPCNIQTK